MHGRQGKRRQAMYQERGSKQWAREKRGVTRKWSGKEFERQARGTGDKECDRKREWQAN